MIRHASSVSSAERQEIVNAWFDGDGIWDLAKAHRLRRRDVVRMCDEARRRLLQRVRR